jgi:hypothetical protein
MRSATLVSVMAGLALAGFVAMGAIGVVGTMGGTAMADIPPERTVFPKPRPKPKPVVDAPDAVIAEVPDTKGDGPDAGATKAGAADAETAKVAPDKAVRLPGERKKRLDDGMYRGPVIGAGSEAEIQLTVVNGFIVEALIRRTGEGLVPFDLNSVGASNAAGIRLQGNEGNEFVRISGEILDGERGFGSFDGVLVRKQVSGTWTVSRR